MTTSNSLTGTITAPGLLAPFKATGSLRYRRHTVLDRNGAADGSLYTTDNLSLPLDFHPTVEGQQHDGNELHVDAGGDVFGVINSAAHTDLAVRVDVKAWCKEFLNRDDVTFI